MDVLLDPEVTFAVRRRSGWVDVRVHNNGPAHALALDVVAGVIAAGAWREADCPEPMLAPGDDATFAVQVGADPLDDLNYAVGYSNRLGERKRLTRPGTLGVTIEETLSGRGVTACR
jgi:hypothetical protein